MLPKMRLKRIVGFLLVLGIAGAIGIGPSKAQAQGLLTPTMAVRFGAPDESAHILDMAPVITPAREAARRRCYLAVLSQRTTSRFPWIPVPFPFPPDAPLIPAPPRTTSSGSAAPGPSGWAPGIYRDIIVLRLINVTREPWVELFSKEYEQPDWPIAVECLELPRTDGTNSQLLIAVLMSNRLEYYNTDGTKAGETLLPESIDGLATAYYDLTVKRNYREPFVISQKSYMILAGAARDPLTDETFGCLVGLTSDGTDGLEVVWAKVVSQAPGGFIKVDATEGEDGCYAAMISPYAICTLTGTSLSRYIWRGFDVYYAPTGIEFVDVAVAKNPLNDEGAIIFALANKKTPDGGSKAVLLGTRVRKQMQIVKQLTIAEPCEPEGQVCGQSLSIYSPGQVKWFNSRKGFGFIVAGTTTGPIAGCSTPYNGGASDIFVAALELSPDLQPMSTRIELYGGPGDDGLFAMALGGRPTDVVKKKASRMGLRVYLGCYVASAFDATFGAWHTQSVGGIGTDPIIIELKTPAAMLEDLIAKVESMNLHHGIENSLTKKLRNAQKSLIKDNNKAAANKLQAFINQCDTQAGKKLTADQADQLILDALEIIDVLQQL